MGDRLTSLMLGLPYGVNEKHANMTVGGKDVWECKNADGFMVKCAIIAGRVTDNLLSSKPATIAEALEIDATLDKVGHDVEDGFWSLAPASSIKNAKELVDWQVQVLQQMCWHQCRVYLHMPFMLQSATNSRYEYSRKACLDGAREMLKLYHMIRSSGFSIYQCKVVDFIGFTADTVLFLGLLGYGRLSSAHDPVQDEADWRLIETSMEVLKVAATEKGGKVAEQSYNVLKMFHNVRNYEGSGEGDESCVTKVAIPCKFLPHSILRPELTIL